ncbi:acetyltransferase [Glaciecola sp. XM2]|uniref:acetyltransferase n=1 Tax=Glaciecola sp. XM2 TaxID=1914931 RepID=UPI001BDF2E89|nr:acetyltransferase [Glaciecola sp. XM2]MBT1450708.1 acetyltransferase [Glaciecola sp. XM2]
MTKELAIVGASGHGKVIADMAEQLGFTVKFYDDAYPSITHIEHWSIHGTCADLLALMNTDSLISHDAVVAIGNNETRQKITQLLLHNRFNLITLVHPTAVVSQYAEVSQGVVVCAGAIINPFAKIGIGCIINTSAVVEHDCRIHEFAHICPNAAIAGGSIIGSSSWIGVGSQVKQLIQIGTNCMIGAGSTVVKNIPDNATAFGSPAVVKESN